jgi:hypothetical protein
MAMVTGCRCWPIRNLSMALVGMSGDRQHLPRDDPARLLPRFARNCLVATAPWRLELCGNGQEQRGAVAVMW